MSFCNLNIEVSENYSEQHFPAMWRGGSSYLSVHYHRFFVVVLTSLFHVQTSFLSKCNLFKIQRQCLCSEINMSPEQLPQVIKQFMFNACWNS